MKIKIDLPLEKTLNMSSEVILVNEKLWSLLSSVLVVI